MKEHAELLGDEADALLNELIDHWQQEQDAEVVTLLTDRSALLRHCREIGVDAAFAELREPVVSPLQEALVAFINADTWPESQQFVAEHPELLSDEADVLMGQLTEMQENDDARTMLEMHRHLLRRCREIGIDAAFVALVEPARPSDMPRRIELCQRALRQTARDEQPELWATLQDALGKSLAQSPLGIRAENLEQAIGHYQQALEVRTRQIFPEQWAATQNNLAIAYLDRIRGERAENLEEAIKHCQQALEVRTRQALPEQWAVTQNNLAIAYLDRIRGERADNLDQAIRSCQQALEAYTNQALTEGRAMIQNNLATAYLYRIHGERAENLEQAISIYQQSLEFYTRQTFPERWAAIHDNLGIAYQRRIRGEPAENLEQALAHCQQVRKVFTREAFPEQWADTQNNLATIYLNRMNGERHENLEQAIRCCKQALEVYTLQAFPERYAMTQNNLATGYSKRTQGERAENLEQAIAHYQQALEVYTRQAFPKDWAMTQNGLAVVYAQRIRGKQAENLEHAISHLEQALEVYTCHTFPIEHRQTQCNLGSLCLEQQRWGMAAQAFRGALDAGDLLYTGAATPEARQTELREVKGLPAGLAYALAQQAGQEQALMQEAVVVLERNRARWLAEGLALNAEKPAAVPEPLWRQFTQAAEQVRQLQAVSQQPDNTPGKPDYLTLSPLLTTARHKLAASVEQVRQRDPSFMPEPQFAQIQAALAPSDTQSAGVYLLTTPLGGLAFVIRSDRVEVLHLRELTDEALDAMLHDWFDAYSVWQDSLKTNDKQARQSASDNWSGTIEQVTHRLWDLAAKPITDALQELRRAVAAGERPAALTFIPTGLLALLPLHAAWTEDPETPTGRRFFLDDFAVRYAPSATALRHALKAAATELGQHLLAIDEPKPITRGSSLPNSAREVNAISDLFTDPNILRHRDATREQVLPALPPADIVHFSCHGANNWTSPLETGLLMAHDQMLTVRSLLELKDAAGRLISLSACETGIVGTDLPDEVIDLPSALLQVGFGGVVASLWSVPDISTAMLMVRFYQFWRTEGFEPVIALRAAQRWVRDTTNKQKADYFGQFVPGLASRMAEPVALEFFSAAMESREGLNARTFKDPFWWAAFYITGV
ncbi:MAG: CHAT domain-containing protein [Chloroflexi bacterium]|nr:CHAT domain-containing protein [Chloroflexota bacterium]